MTTSKPAIIASGGIIAAMSFVMFYLVPGAIERFSFSIGKFMTGDVYRLFTFFITHVTQKHLIENMIALGLSMYLAIELELTGKKLLFCFIGSSIVIALMESPLFPGIMMAGASVGLAAILGLLSLQGNRYISSLILIPVFLAPMIIKYFMELRLGSALTFAELIFHVSGFVVGLAFFILMKKAAELRKKRILQMNDYETD